MTTPVDIEKLKELEQIAADIEYAVTGGMMWIDHSEAYEFARRIRAVTPALIAKAERVDVLERALGPFVSGSPPSVTDDDSIPDHAIGSIQVTMGELRASPKESE